VKAGRAPHVHAPLGLPQRRRLAVVHSPPAVDRSRRALRRMNAAESHDARLIATAHPQVGAQQRAGLRQAASRGRTSRAIAAARSSSACWRS
jgi:hypothetical protein